MLSRTTTVIVALTCLPFLSCTPGQHGPMHPDAIAKAWDEATAVNDNHRLLHQFAGDWNATITWWDEETGVPISSKAQVTIRVVLGGKFIEERFDGIVMGSALTGRGFTGYDNMKKAFVSAWLDSTGTSITLNEGRMRDEATLEFFGETRDPTLAEPIPTRSILQLRSPETHTYTLYEIHNNEEKRILFIEYQRLVSHSDQ